MSGTTTIVRATDNICGYANGDRSVSVACVAGPAARCAFVATNGGPTAAVCCDNPEKCQQAPTTCLGREDAAKAGYCEGGVCPSHGVIDRTYICAQDYNWCAKRTFPGLEATGWLGCDNEGGTTTVLTTYNGQVEPRDFDTIYLSGPLPNLPIQPPVEFTLSDVVGIMPTGGEGGSGITNLPLSDQSSSHFNAGAIAGVAIGSVLAVCGALLVFCFVKKRKDARNNDADDEMYANLPGSPLTVASGVITSAPTPANTVAHSISLDTMPSIPSSAMKAPPPTPAPTRAPTPTITPSSSQAHIPPGVHPLRAHRVFADDFDFRDVAGFGRSESEGAKDKKDDEVQPENDPLPAVADDVGEMPSTTDNNAAAAVVAAGGVHETRLATATNTQKLLRRQSDSMLPGGTVVSDEHDLKRSLSHAGSEELKQWAKEQEGKQSYGGAK